MTPSNEPRYPWDKAPEWAMWAFRTNHTGRAYWSNIKPQPCDCGCNDWMLMPGEYSLIDISCPCPHWRETLEARRQPRKKGDEPRRPFGAYLERYLREAKLQPRKEGDAAHSSTDYETNPNFDHMPAVQPGRAGEVQPPPAAATPRLTMEEIEGVRYNLDKICLFSARVRDAVCDMALESLDLTAELSTLRGQVMGLETVVAHFKALAERTK